MMEPLAIEASDSSEDAKPPGHPDGATKKPLTDEEIQERFKDTRPIPDLTPREVASLLHDRCGGLDFSDGCMDAAACMIIRVLARHKDWRPFNKPRLIRTLKHGGRAESAVDFYVRGFDALAKSGLIRFLRDHWWTVSDYFRRCSQLPPEVRFAQGGCEQVTAPRPRG